MTDVTAQFAALAFPFLPADPQGRGVVLETGRTWEFDAAAVPADADIVVWGRLPTGSGAPAALARSAVAREVALRTLPRLLRRRGFSVGAVHRLAPRRLGGTGPRGAARGVLRGGALVEVTSQTGARRVLDAVADAAGASGIEGGVYAGSGGSVLVRAHLVDGSPVILRVGRAGALGDPAEVGQELERLAAAAVPLAPQLVDRGIVNSASWVAEVALPGHRPARVTPAIARQVAEACARFPRAGGPPTALADDLRGAAERLPDHADALRRLAHDMEPVVSRVPGVLRHGDLWSGNLLVDRGRLAGMIDWDALHAAGVPGADVVQLLATDARRRARQHLGEGFLARPWRSEGFRRLMAGYWPAVDVTPADDALDAAALAWWATEVHHTLARLPHRASDEHWVATNVDAVLAGLGY